jgi:hypothetical protein
LRRSLAAGNLDKRQRRRRQWQQCANSCPQPSFYSTRDRGQEERLCSRRAFSSWRCFPFVESAPRAYRLKASNAASPCQLSNISRDIPYGRISNLWRPVRERRCA